MNKRDFLKTSGALVTAGLLSHLEGEELKTPRTNWAGNYTFRAARLHTPQTAAEVAGIVKKSERLKALGARHSFNSIADSPMDQISLKNLMQMRLDRKAKTVTVGAGVTYGHLAPYLDGEGFAVHNLASLPHVSVAGATATATHGSGIKNGNLSTAVAGLELVTATGEMVRLSREKDGDEFHGAIVHLGAMGVVTEVTLNVQPKFQMRQAVYRNLSMAHLEHHLDEIFSAGYSVSLFTDWQNHRVSQVWIKRRLDQESSPRFEREFFGAQLATENLHPLDGHSAVNCTEQMGVAGPWYERLPHFRMNFTPSSGAELQSEFFVPRAKAYKAILAVEKLKDKVTPHLFITELRTIDADELWMSPAYKRASMAIHFTWKPEWPAVRQLLPQIESQLAPFGARPHWAKLFTMKASHLKPLYEKLPDYLRMVRHYDPRGKFHNDFLEQTVLA